MNNSKKRGFTIVELVIVIAVIAILAGVLIPTFSSIVKKANLSADERAVRQMNTALQIYTAENGAPSDFSELKKVLDENGINVYGMTPISKGYSYYWDKANNQILLVSSDATVPTESVVIDTNAPENFEAAKVGETVYSSLQEALNNATDGTTITLQNDLKIEEPLAFNTDANITIDLNGKTLYNTKDIWDDDTSRWSLMDIYQGTATIKGGTFRAKALDCYALAVRGGKCVIEGGEFVGNIDSVFVDQGELEIKGGTFSVQQLDSTHPYGYVLNCSDKNFKDGSAKISVMGGTFINFDPSNSPSEGGNTNFCATGYTVTSSVKVISGANYTFYTVSAE